jgi:hypothetical protein
MATCPVNFKAINGGVVCASGTVRTSRPLMINGLVNSGWNAECSSPTEGTATEVSVTCCSVN